MVLRGAVDPSKDSPKAYMGATHPGEAGGARTGAVSGAGSWPKPATDSELQDPGWLPISISYSKESGGRLGGAVG